MFTKLNSDVRTIIKVLILSNSPNIGGAEKSLQTFLSRSNVDKMTFYVIAPSGGQVEKEQIFNKASKVMFLDKLYPLSKKQPIKYLISLIKIYFISKKIKPDLIYCNSIISMHWGLPLSVLIRIPQIVHIRDKNASGSSELFFKLCHKNSIFIANSFFTKDLFQTRFKLQNISVVYNAVDTSVFNSNYDIADYSEDFNNRNDYIWKIGIVGRITKWKGHMNVIQAARLMISRKNIHWFVIGGTEAVDDKDFLAKLNKTIHSYNLENSITFTGYRNDIPELLNFIDILLLPSEYEPFGRVVIEAMACGTPVIASNEGGPSEIISHLNNGFLLSSCEPDNIVDAINQLINDSMLYEKITKNGKITATKKFSNTEYISQIENIFLKALAE